MQLTTRKIRRPQQCTTPKAILVAMAMDRRSSLRRALNPRDPAAALDEVLITLKHDVTAALAPETSAVLLSAEHGPRPCIASATLPGSTSLIAALERTGYPGGLAARASELMTGWKPQQALQLAASSVESLAGKARSSQLHGERKGTAPQEEQV